MRARLGDHRSSPAAASPGGRERRHQLALWLTSCAASLAVAACTNVPSSDLVGEINSSLDAAVVQLDAVGHAADAGPGADGATSDPGSAGQDASGRTQDSDMGGAADVDAASRATDASTDGPDRQTDAAMADVTDPTGAADAVTDPDDSGPDRSGGSSDAPAPQDTTTTPDVNDPDETEPPPEPLPYPTRSVFELKGLQPDFWPDLDEISGNGVGGVAMNLVWAFWEGGVKSPPCGGGEQEYDGHCFKIDAAVDAAIEEWTDRGLVVTGVVYGVPSWARIPESACSPVAPGFEIFCAPKNANDYGRFAGMLAQRYDGLQGHGRVADFVIHNEVNTNDWFDVGCGQGVPCDASAWIQTYADSYKAAYDAVMAHQPTAKVLTSFTHHFDTAFDTPTASHAVISVKTFLQTFAGLVGDRTWRVAYHPYPPDLLEPAFGADDLPRVTYGNLGALVGWLIATFPNNPAAWEVQLTESGVNSVAPASSTAAQSDGVCKSLYNAVGTPFIESYIYHRMQDHPAELAGGLGLGLVNVDGSKKPAWSTWALANRADLDPPQLSCGFQYAPFTRLTLGKHNQRGRRASTRHFPPGFSEQAAWYLHRDEKAGTHLLVECLAGDDGFVSAQLDCEGQTPFGPLGWIHDEPAEGTVPLYRCYSAAAGDHFVAADAGCGGASQESLLGHALVAPTAPDIGDPIDPEDPPPCEDCGDIVQVRRFYWSNSTDGDHMFGLSPGAAPSGYVDEGPQFNLYASTGPGLVPVYQSYCGPCTDHLQTLTATEASPTYGDPQVLGYCSPTQTGDTPHELRRLYLPKRTDHMASTNQDEWAAATAGGWELESTLCWTP